MVSKDTRVRYNNKLLKTEKQLCCTINLMAYLIIFILEKKLTKKFYKNSHFYNDSYDESIRITINIFLI